MRALTIKLGRDLWRLRAQVLTIAMVVAIGVGGFVGLFSVHASLLDARDRFYASHRLADVFVALKRAPLALRDLGLTEADLDRAAQIATKNPYENPRAFDATSIRALLQAAWEGSRPKD